MEVIQLERVNEARTSEQRYKAFVIFFSFGYDLSQVHLTVPYIYKCGCESHIRTVTFISIHLYHI